MVATVGHTIVVEIVSIHEWLDCDTKNIRGTNQQAADCREDAPRPTLVTSTDDRVDFLFIENGFLRHVVHDRLEIDALGDIE